MKKPHKRITSEIESGWKQYLESLNESLQQLEKDIDEASQMSEICTAEWCQATEHVIDELSNSLFSIHEPAFVSQQDSQKLKDLRKRIHELYAKYKAAAS